LVVVDLDAPEDLNIVVAVLDHEGAPGVTAEVRRQAETLGTVHKDAVADEDPLAASVYSDVWTVLRQLTDDGSKGR
jgi:hypothetical protein